MRFAPALIALSCLAVLLTGCGISDGQEKGGPHKKGGGNPMAGMPPPEVNVVTVEPKSIPVTFEYVGQTAGSREVEVRARVTGILLSRNFKEGSHVKKGESLYTIDPAPFQAALARAEADVAGAEAREEQAKKNAARLKPLFAEKAVSQKDYDDAASAEQIAAADLKSARARLTEARLNLAYTKVESPINGQASRSLRSEGTLVSGPDVLLTTVVQVDPIWVNFGIPDSEQSRMQEDINAGRLVMPKGGTYEVSLRLADGTTYSKTGKLGFSDVKVNPATGTREARGELPNPDGRIRPGEFVRVILKGATRPNAMTVPQRAVLEGPQGKFVYVVDEKGTAQPRPVQAGEWNGQDWIIAGGLKPGDRVIVDGLMKLGPGAPVRIAQAQEGPQKPPAQKK
ncbi:MAG TPA: efflux RND transporter periplasmic adaptor subunit [Burkholderiales bacterium]|nr:efflux RND transporter periplasmic adaptor subunit [Burkholderiales bacterium]